MHTHSAGGPKRGVWLDTLYDAATRTACDTHTATATQAQRKQVRTNFCPAAMRQFKPYIYLPMRHTAVRKTHCSNQRASKLQQNSSHVTATTGTHRTCEAHMPR